MSTVVEALPPPVSAPTTATATTQPITPTSVTTMSPVSVTRAENATSPQVASDSSDPNSVRELVRKQLEYYFSTENLAGDFYLVSKMNADKYVNIAEIASFPKLHRLSQDIQLIKSVMQESPVMHVDRTCTMVRPTSLGIQRNTLMLREIPSTAPEEEVRALFGDAESSISSCRADVGDNWFVKFDTENDCMAAADVLRSAMYQGKAVRFRVKSENLMRSAYANMSAGLGGDASASVGVGAGAGGFQGGYAAQPFPGYNPYLYMYPGQMMGNPYATYYPGAQQPFTPYGQQSLAQPNANLAPLNTQSPNAKNPTEPNSSFSLQQQPTPRGRGSYNSGGGARGSNYRSGGGRGGRNNRHNQNNYQQQGVSNSFQTRTTSFRQVNHNNSQASPANGAYQQQPSLFQQVGTGANVTALNTEAAPGGDNILSRLMNPGPQTNGHTGGRGQQQRGYGGGRRGGGKSKPYGESVANELVLPQTAADPDDHNEFPALSVARSTYSQPLSSSQTSHSDGIASQTASDPTDATASQQQDHRPAVKYSMSQMKSFIDNLKNEQLPLPEEFRATLKGLAPKTIHPLIRANPRKYLSALSQPPAIMTPESPFTAVAQVPCDLPALSIGEADSRGVAPPPVNCNRTLHGHQQKQSHHAFPSHPQHGAFSTSPSDHYQPPHGHTVSNAHSTRQQTHFRNASGGGGQTAQQKRSPQPNSLLSALANKGSVNTKSGNGNDAPMDASTTAANTDDNASANSNHVGKQKLATPSPDRKESASSPGAPPREGESDVVNHAPNGQNPTLGKATSSAKGDEMLVIDGTPSSSDSSTTTADSK